LFEKQSTSIYHNPYWIELSASFWEGSIGTGYPRSNGINVYRRTAANPTLEDIQAARVSAWAEYNESLAQEQDLAFNQDHINPADFFVDLRINEGISIGRRCLWMDRKGNVAGTDGGSVAETFTIG
jgi:hypothetical protein